MTKEKCFSRLNVDKKDNSNFHINIHIHLDLKFAMRLYSLHYLMTFTENFIKISTFKYTLNK